LAAIIDFQYAYNLKQSKSIYILTAWKDNLAPMMTASHTIAGSGLVFPRNKRSPKGSGPRRPFGFSTSEIEPCHH
jgi:hypothetical protein